MQHDRTKRVGLELRRKKLFRFEHFATRGNVHQNLHLIAKKWISRSCADQQIIHLSGRQVATHSHSWSCNLHWKLETFPAASV